MTNSAEDKSVITCKAWDLMGKHYHDLHNGTHLVRLKGGRALYTDVVNTKTDNIRLSRIEGGGDSPVVTHRYIQWDTAVELVPIREDEQDG